MLKIGRKVGWRKWEVGPGIIIEPQFVERVDGREVQDGWQIVIDGEWDNDATTRRAALERVKRVYAGRLWIG